MQLRKLDVQGEYYQNTENWVESGWVWGRRYEDDKLQGHLFKVGGVLILLIIWRERSSREGETGDASRSLNILEDTSMKERVWKRVMPQPLRLGGRTTGWGCLGKSLWAGRNLRELCFTNSPFLMKQKWNYVLKSNALCTGIIWGALKILMLGSTAREAHIIGLGCSLGTGVFKRSWGDFSGLPRLRTTSCDRVRGLRKEGRGSEQLLRGIEKGAEDGQNNCEASLQTRWDLRS